MELGGSFYSIDESQKSRNHGCCIHLASGASEKTSSLIDSHYTYYHVGENINSVVLVFTVPGKGSKARARKPSKTAPRNSRSVPSQKSCATDNDGFQRQMQGLVFVGRQVLSQLGRQVRSRRQILLKKKMEIFVLRVERLKRAAFTNQPTRSVAQRKAFAIQGRAFFLNRVSFEDRNYVQAVYVYIFILIGCLILDCL